LSLDPLSAWFVLICNQLCGKIDFFGYSISEFLALAILIVIGIVIIIVIVKLLLIFLPAAIIAFIVWWFTSPHSLFWAGVAFLVVAIISIVRRI
jgi:hypothetical protein